MGHAVYNERTVLEELVGILESMTVDWDMSFGGRIGPDTQLVADLQFESIDVVQLMVAIEERFKCKGMPFEEFLMIDGRYVDEIIVKDLAAFLNRQLSTLKEE